MECLTKKKKKRNKFKWDRKKKISFIHKHFWCSDFPFSFIINVNNFMKFIGILQKNFILNIYTG